MSGLDEVLKRWRVVVVVLGWWVLIGRVFEGWYRGGAGITFFGSYAMTYVYPLWRAGRCGSRKVMRASRRPACS